MDMQDLVRPRPALPEELMKPEQFYVGWNAIWFHADRDRVMTGDPTNLPR